MLDPCASLESQFSYTPSSMEFGNFSDLNPYPMSSSPEPMHSERAGIVMLSLPDTPDSVEQQVRNGEAAHFSPEERRCRHKSPASGVKKARVLDGSSEDETEVKKTRVGSEEVIDIGSEDSGKTGDEKAKLKSVVGNGCAEELLSNDGKGTEGGGGKSGMAGEKNQRDDGVGAMKGGLDFVEQLKFVVTNIENGSNEEEGEREDIAVVAKRFGITLPRPRWWPAEWVD